MKIIKDGVMIYFQHNDSELILNEIDILSIGFEVVGRPYASNVTFSCVICISEGHKKVFAEISQRDKEYILRSLYPKLAKEIYETG